MKRFLFLALFTLMTGIVSSESTLTPASATPAVLSLSLTPEFMGDLGIDLFGPGLGMTIACNYRLPALPLYAGMEFGYSWLGLKGDGGYPSGALSMLQAGIVAGFQLDILPTLGLRCFGSAGYSYNIVQPIVSGDPFYSFFRLNYGTARGGTPYAGVGAELSWAFIPGLGLAAGVRYRNFLDLYSGVAISAGVSCNFIVGGAKSVKPSTLQALPLKTSPHPQPRDQSEDPIVEELYRFVAPKEATLRLFSNTIASAMKPNASRDIDKNLQYAIGFHEAVRLLGIAFSSHSSDSSTLASRNDTATVKLPLQTVQDRSGDRSDLSVLYCSLLESVRVDTAFITTPGHLFIAFALSSREEADRKTLQYVDEFIFRRGKVWVPIEVTECNASFLTAWQAGAKAWRTARKQAHLYPLSDAEAASPPGSAVSGILPPMPDPAQFVESFQREVARVLAREEGK